MNLADYEKMDTERPSGGEFIKFTKQGETRYMRFLYESGGEKMGEDISIRRKKWDEAAKKYVYDTEDGQLMAVLKAVEYDEDGSNPRLVKWERSAYFCKNTLLPMFRNYPRIIDGVWKITVTNPGTMDISFSLFPVMNADTIKYPIIKDEEKKEETQLEPIPDQAETKPAEPAPRKKYWE